MIILIDDDGSLNESLMYPLKEAGLSSRHFLVNKNINDMTQEILNTFNKKVLVIDYQLNSLNPKNKIKINYNGLELLYKIRESAPTIPAFIYTKSKDSVINKPIDVNIVEFNSNKSEEELDDHFSEVIDEIRKSADKFDETMGILKEKMTKSESLQEKIELNTRIKSLGEKPENPEAISYSEEELKEEFNNKLLEIIKVLNDV